MPNHGTRSRGSRGGGFTGLLKRLTVKTCLRGLLGVVILVAGFIMGNASSGASTAIGAAMPTSSEGHTQAGAVIAADRISRQMGALLMLTPAQRQVEVAKIVTGNKRAEEANRLDQTAPEITTLLGLPANVDNRTQAYFYVDVLDKRLLAYNGDSASVVLLTAATAGTKSGSASLEARGVEVMSLLWQNGAWRYNGTRGIGSPQFISTTTPEGASDTLGALVKTFSEVRNDSAN
jgi:hypothetical protein